MDFSAKPPGIVIYDLGQYGAMIARLAAGRGWPAVAAFNRAGPEAGRDLGRDPGAVVQDRKGGDCAGLDADAGLNPACHGVQSRLPQGNDPRPAALRWPRIAA